MTDLRAQLPECPLEYEVPPIPGTHTALVIAINAADIHWQEKMLPWTLAGLINNTDIVMKGVHIYIDCEDDDTEDRIKTALKRFDLPRYDTPMNRDIAPPFHPIWRIRLRLRFYMLMGHKLLGISRTERQG